MSSGIPFFPLDVHLDDKFELIEAEYGLKGFAVVVKLLQKIYGGQGYYCEWTSDVELLFAKNIGLGGSSVSEIVAASIKRGIFDSHLFEEYHILTSKGIQKRCFEAYARRKRIEIEKRYLLVDVTQICKNVNIFWKNADISSENVNNFSHRIEEERIEEDRRGEEEAKPLPAPSPKPRFKKFGIYKHVNLTDEQYSKLISDYGERLTAEYIKRCDNYVQQSGKIYKDYNLTIRIWLDRDGHSPKGGAPSKNVKGENRSLGLLDDIEEALSGKYKGKKEQNETDII